MTSSPIRKHLVQVAGVGVVAFVALLIAVGVLVVRSGPKAESVRAELARRSELPRPEAERAEVIGLARGTRSRPPAPPASAPTPPAPASTPTPAAAAAEGPPPRDLMHPAYDALFGRDPAERPIHDWLRAIRLTRSQPDPPPPDDVVRVLADVAPALDALAEYLSDHVVEESAPFLAPSDRYGRIELEHARVLLLAAACAESLAPSGDPTRGERLVEAAWTLHRGLPVGIDDAGPGDLVLAVLRQVRVTDARAWSDRIAEMDPQSRLASALEWDAAARLARLERTAERRKQVKPGWVPASVQRAVGIIRFGHDSFFTSRFADAEAALAKNVRALDPCEDPWLLAGLDTGEMAGRWAIPGEVRMTTALASASLAQADVALTLHVLLRRHGLAPPHDACGTQVLVERHEGGDRFVVGWRIPGRDEPGAADRERPRNDAPNFRTWPEPSLPGPPLDPFSFEAPMPLASVPASAPTP